MVNDLAKLDDLLVSYVQATQDQQIENELTVLMQNTAEPVISAVIRSKIRSLGGHWHESYDDLCSEARFNVLRSLRQLKENPQQKAITRFRSYVSVVASQVWDAHLRQHFPLRWRLKNQVRYLLNHDKGLLLRESSDGVWLASLADTADHQANDEVVKRLKDDPRKDIKNCPAPGSEIRVYLRSVLGSAGGALELDDLVAIVQKLKNEPGAAVFISLDADPVERFADSSILPDQLEQRFYLFQVWQEICALPPMQRISMLLNLRSSSGRSLLQLFPVTGIAGIEKIAEALSMSVEALSSIWNDLPFEDSAIAERLKINRQQVINLRKSARERLVRRLNRSKKVIKPDILHQKEGRRKS
jgi:hypothetical protein